MAVLQEWHGAGVFSQLNADGTGPFTRRSTIRASGTRKRSHPPRS